MLHWLLSQTNGSSRILYFMTHPHPRILPVESIVMRERWWVKCKWLLIYGLHWGRRVGWTRLRVTPRFYTPIVNFLQTTRRINGSRCHRRGCSRRCCAHAALTPHLPLILIIISAQKAHRFRGTQTEIIFVFEIGTCSHPNSLVRLLLPPPHPICLSIPCVSVC